LDRVSLIAVDDGPITLCNRRQAREIPLELASDFLIVLLAPGFKIFTFTAARATGQQTPDGKGKSQRGKRVSANWPQTWRVTAYLPTR